MGTTLIHISDIHYRPDWYENHGIVLRALFDDIKKQIEKAPTHTFYAVLSGDVVYDGDDSKSYDQFHYVCSTAFDELGINPSSLTSQWLQPRSRDRGTTSTTTSGCIASTPLYFQVGELLADQRNPSRTRIGLR